MTQLVAVPAVTSEGLVLFDLERRTYLGLSRDESYWHVVRPLRADDPGVAEGNVQVGDLTCCCAGGTFKGHCYRIAQAIAFERERASELRWGELEPAAAAAS